MKANDFNNLIANNCKAAADAIVNGTMSFETVIGILESHQQALFDWRRNMIALSDMEKRQIIVPSSTLPANPVGK